MNQFYHFFSLKSISLREKNKFFFIIVFFIFTFISSLAFYQTIEFLNLLKNINNLFFTINHLLDRVLLEKESLFKSLIISDFYIKKKFSLLKESIKISTQVADRINLKLINYKFKKYDLKKIKKELEMVFNFFCKFHLSLSNKKEVIIKIIYHKLILKFSNLKNNLKKVIEDFNFFIKKYFYSLKNLLELIVFLFILVSFLLLWLGYKTLRTFKELIILAQNIKKRCLKKEGKIFFYEVSGSCSEEVSQLYREYHRIEMALLEREKTVEIQRNRLQEQSRLLSEIGVFNKNILDSIGSILIVTDLKGKITQCNLKALQWLKKTENEVIDCLVTEIDLLIPLFNVAHYRSKIKKDVSQNSFNHQKIWLELLKNLDKPWKMGPIKIQECVFHFHLMPFCDGNLSSQSAIIILEDLTYEQNLKERLRRAENLATLGQLSAQVAHEVRNPLHSIGLEAEMAFDLASRLGSVSLKQSLESILLSVDRLKKMTENYLKFSRLSHGKKTDVDLEEVILAVMATYSSLFKVQKIKINFKKNSKISFLIFAEKILIEQVLFNLLNNSLQALEGYSSQENFQAEISIILGEREENLSLIIKDNGPGVSPDIQDHIFTPFFTTRAQGTGLGLYFIKKVIEDHSGSFFLKKSNLEEGACFECLFPRRDKNKKMNDRLDRNITQPTMLCHEVNHYV